MQSPQGLIFLRLIYPIKSKFNPQAVSQGVCISHVGAVAITCEPKNQRLTVCATHGPRRHAEAPLELTAEKEQIGITEHFGHLADSHVGL